MSPESYDNLKWGHIERKIPQFVFKNNATFFPAVCELFPRFAGEKVCATNFGFMDFQDPG